MYIVFVCGDSYVVVRFATPPRRSLQPLTRWKLLMTWKIALQPYSEYLIFICPDPPVSSLLLRTLAAL